MVKLYKDGDRMAVETNCTDPDTFIQQCSEVLDKLIEEGEFDGDWALQLMYWLPQIATIYYKLGGDLSELESSSFFVAGHKSKASSVYG